jgi:plasmid stability protein
MATLHVENVPDDLYAKLQQLATTQNLSISAQVVSLLESALQTEAQQPQSDTPKSVAEILADISRRRELRPTELGLPDSTTLIREDRDR